MRAAGSSTADSRLAVAVAYTAGSEDPNKETDTAEADRPLEASFLAEVGTSLEAFREASFLGSHPDTSMDLAEAVPLAVLDPIRATLRSRCSPGLSEQIQKTDLAS